MFSLQTIYRKIPKISPGAYIFQKPFLRDVFLEGLGFYWICWTNLLLAKHWFVSRLNALLNCAERNHKSLSFSLTQKKFDAKRLINQLAVHLAKEVWNYFGKKVIFKNRTLHLFNPTWPQSRNWCTFFVFFPCTCNKIETLIRIIPCSYL